MTNCGDKIANSSKGRWPVWAAVGVLGVVAATCGSDTAQADNWAERLGWPADARVVVLHAHDMGMCYENNEATIALLEAGAISSASAMPPCPWFADAAAWSVAADGHDVGLQLTLNSEYKRYRWSPLGGDPFTRSLIDSDGYFWSRVMQTMVSATAEDVENELQFQMLHAKRMGMRPTHLTTHLGALYSRPDLTEVYLRFAREQWIPAVVIELTPEMAEQFRSQGFAVPDELAATLDSYPLPKIRELRIVPATESLEEKVARVVELIDTLPAGLTQIAFRPASNSPALKAITPDWQQRVWEAEVWENEEVQAALGQPGIVVTNWREIMERFEGANQ